MPLSERYTRKSDKIISTKETKIINGKKSNFNRAFREYNKNKTIWNIPRQETNEYNEVMKIMKEFKINKLFYCGGFKILRF